VLLNLEGLGVFHRRMNLSISGKNGPGVHPSQKAGYAMDRRIKRVKQNTQEH